MEEARRPNHAVPTSPDPDTYGRCTTELARTHSETSAVTVDSLKDNSQNFKASLKSIKWTDHRHKEYLNSLESSLVNQLHQSLLIRGWHSQNNSRVRHCERKLPDQYLVLQDGCCQKISFERNEPMLESTAESHVIAGSPLKHHAKTFENGCFMRESDACDPGFVCDANLVRNVKSLISPGSEKQSGFLCCLDVAGTGIEVTDQNFEEENLGNKSKAKRLKTTSNDISRND